MGLFSGLLGNAGSIDADKLNEEYADLFVPNESVEMGFKLVRDLFILTSKRLLLIDIQGLTGKKVEYLSIPYSKITKFSMETAGTLDLDAELKIWVGSEQIPIENKFTSGVDIYEVQRVLASHVLG